MCLGGLVDSFFMTPFDFGLDPSFPIMRRNSCLLGQMDQ
ncbi:hypothetical protein JL09_g5759 [Pichia kudriavzevii]|uniref:Uncharacterized protein n=1 Tax=Pichia kudriavzevii TaxID=4909 RepID=A0A099NT91_PICKU|nr:hypothetical protein JL09_g5759 [Pichia kudriavzevii]